MASYLARPRSARPLWPMQLSCLVMSIMLCLLCSDFLRIGLHCTFGVRLGT